MGHTTEGFKDYTDIHQALAQALANILHIEESVVCPIITQINPKSPLHRVLNNLTIHIEKRKTKTQHVLGRNTVVKAE